MKKIKKKVRVCGNCKLLGRSKPNIFINGKQRLILWTCPNRWWNKRPNNWEPCDEHKFKTE